MADKRENFEKNSDLNLDMNLQQKLEACFEDSAMDAAAAQYAAEISPFRDAVSKIVTGLCLTCFTLNFLGLGTILPLAGYVLIYLGTRTLRTDSRWMNGAWILAGIELVGRIILQLLSVSPMYEGLAQWVTTFGITSTALEILLLFCLGKGIQTINRGVEGSNAKNPTVPIIFWKAAMLILAIKGVTSWLIIILMVVVFVYSIKYILKISGSISDSGYQLKASPVMIEPKAVWALSAGILIIGLAVITIVSSYTPLDWKPVDMGISGEMTKLRSELVTKGFPEDMLADIADEDLEPLVGEKILHIEVTFNERNNGEASEVMDHQIVYVCMEDDWLQAYVQFSYKDGNHSWIADGLRINSQDKLLTGAQGKLLCEKDGRTMAADIQTSEDSITYPWFGDLTTHYAYGVQYSYPLSGDNQRGYVTWTAEPAAAVYNLDVYRQISPINLYYKPLIPELQGGLSFSFDNDRSKRLSIYDSFWKSNLDAGGDL